LALRCFACSFYYYFFDPTRQEELQVLDITYLHGCVKPTVAVLYQDTKELRHVKTYELLLKEKEFGEGPWSLPNVESGAAKLISVPKPTCAIPLFFFFFYLSLSGQNQSFSLF